MQSLGGKAHRVPIQFATKYLCETGFSSLLSIKTNSQNRLIPKVEIGLHSSRRFHVLTES